MEQLPLPFVDDRKLEVGDRVRILDKTIGGPIQAFSLKIGDIGVVRAVDPIRVSYSSKKMIDRYLLREENGYPSAGGFCRKDLKLLKRG
jgi:hypothetical protein